MNFKQFFIFFYLLFPVFLFAQQKEDSTLSKRNIPTLVISSGNSKDAIKDYQPFANKINDLVHTQLELQFNFDSGLVYGEATLSLRPHFYPTDSLTLDAKGMVIRKVVLKEDTFQKELPYSYDNLKLHISLPHTFTKNETYTVFIKYTAQPDFYASSSPGGSASVTSDKGLFFINPQSKIPHKPMEVWSMGYPESNSVWFPTIDKPNQKSTQDITLTVPDSLTTFSNGILLSKQKNDDGTRSDQWVMDHPNAPYLFTIAAGPFVVVKDHYKNIPVRYFVEKEYASSAKDIFGATPEMMAFFSKILQTPYPWESYDQIVTRDFITGAMENTTATMHGESLYKSKRQLQDQDYGNESIIAHELFHQWFGDLVTCNSWSNITLNESFGNYGEMLWAEHKYGKDMAAQHNYEAMQRYFYFADTHKDHPLVYNDYPDKNEVLDAVSYQKGGRILNMLRQEVGDSAFFASLHEYLEENKFQSADANQLKHAFEKVTGRDLHLFWQQWYHRPGYPKLDIQYKNHKNQKSVSVTLRQTQDSPPFLLHFYIDVYENGKKHRHRVNMKQRQQTYTFNYQKKPELINVDADKILLAEKKDHKTLENYIYQYHHAGNYMDRREALVAADSLQEKHEKAQALLIEALNDSFYGLRKMAISALHMKNENLRQKAFPILKSLLQTDKHSSVRSAALIALTTEHPEQEKALVIKSLTDSSLTVESTALSILNDMSRKEAYQQAKNLERSAESPLSETICTIYAQNGNPADFSFVKKQVYQTGSFEKMNFLPAYIYMLGHSLTNTQTIKTELSTLIPFAKVVGPRYGYYIISLLNDFVIAKQNAATKTSSSDLKKPLSEQADFGKKIMMEIGQILD